MDPLYSYQDKVIKIFDELVGQNDHYFGAEVIDRVVSNEAHTYRPPDVRAVFAQVTYMGKPMKSSCLFIHTGENEWKVTAAWPEGFAQAIMRDDKHLVTFILGIINNPQKFTEVMIMK
ncbi:MAG: hypothetical protein DRP09_00650 [Candidatus Thorarchaeota archaeon]|nr:MAG: hypothetical protein DRP09_00650 [Candidatus Thorarchaeota archaeon]